MYYHNKNPDIFDNMIPWEKDIYVNMIVKKVEEENEKAKLKEAANRAAAKTGR